jgi:hypothetical protein
MDETGFVVGEPGRSYFWQTGQIHQKGTIMKFHVKGAHRETAEDIEMLVEANSEDAAAQTVTGMSVMVEKIVPAGGPLSQELVRFEYHTLRCDFGDLQSHLNNYAQRWWRVLNIHHDPHDDKMVRVVLERIHRVDPTLEH